jgi:superfamily II DNA or RNA helicase
MTAKTRANLTSLERLERQILTISGDRAQGDAWEKALRAWINAGGHPELTKAWMWGEWPGKLKAGLKGDKGVDLVAETRDKQLVAIQVKFRRDPNDPVTAPEVQKLVGSYRKHFALFALASNAWSATRGVSEAVGDEDAMLILREQLLESSYDWAAKKSIKRTKFTPFPFQKVAAENVRKALAKGGRAQIVMACGTGKTVTMLLAAEALDAQRVLVLAPTLLLVKQLRDEWISKRRPDREWASLAVCSDIGDGMDASEIAPAEFGAPPTTNPDEIAAFLKKPGRRVVFGTYASSDRIAKAQKKAGVPAFDLAVADEAHRIAGVVGAKDKSERSQRVMLEEKEIKAVRRLFATATPRITGSKKTRDGDEILIESMDDESRFGKVAHSVTFQEAVKLKRLVPYKLVVTIATNDEVADAVQNRRFIDVKGKPYAADEVATAIAIRRAYKELGISKIISYHSRVAGAKSFADLITQVPGRGKSPVTEHVAGSMPVNDRKQVLNRLAAATEPYLVTNARCLTEGIDVPALDAVAFADPRKSQVDIVQAVGRAMRRPMGKSTKRTGYIILPVYLTKKDLKDPETAVEGSAFDPVLQVLRALKDHDPFMARFIAKILVAKGKKPHKKAGGIGEILEVSIGDELDKVLARRLMEAVQLRAIEVASSAVERNIVLLEKFVAREGHAVVPDDHREDGYGLGWWVGVIRNKPENLTPEQKDRLNRLGFIWDLKEWQFDLWVSLLRQYVSRYGHAGVPYSHKEDGEKLGQWVANIRSRKDRLTDSMRNALDAVGFIWNPKDVRWNENYGALKFYLANGGDVAVPKGTVQNDINLHNFVEVQRRKRQNGTLPSRQLEMLERLNLLWNPQRDQFELMFSLLTKYHAKHGHCEVPKAFVASGGYALGEWVIRQRALKEKIPLDRRTRLDQLGFVWDVYAQSFSRGLTALTKFKNREGHASPSQKHVEDGFSLGTWLSSRRMDFRKGRLTGDQIASLNNLGVSWDQRATVFDRFIAELKSYHAETGHTRVPVGYVRNGLRLGEWARSLRSRRGHLSRTEKEALDTLGFSWNLREDLFGMYLDCLKAFIEREGHAMVPQKHVESGLKLGVWVSTIRRRQKLGRLNKTELAGLKAVGFIFKSPIGGGAVTLRKRLRSV